MNTMFKRGALLAIAALAMFVSACSTTAPPGAFNGLGDDPMAMITITSSDGVVEADEYQLGQAAAVQCHAFTDLQQTGAEEALLASGAAYSVGYGAGGAAQLSYPGATAGTAQAGVVVGLAQGFAGGAVNGLLNRSFAGVSAVGTCTESTLRDWQDGIEVPAQIRTRFPNYADLASGLHAQASFVRTHNRIDQPASGLVNQSWSGPIAGERRRQ